MYINWNPSAWRLSDFRLLYTKEPRYARPRQVYVENAYCVSLERECQRQLCGDTAFTDSAFAGKDEENVPNIIESHRVDVGTEMNRARGLT